VKQNEFLFSPLESPFDDSLSTSGLGNDDFISDFSPLIADDDGFGAFFHGNPLFEPSSSSDRQAAPPLFPAMNLYNMYTIPPGTAPFPPRLPSNLPTYTRKSPLDSSILYGVLITPDSILTL